MEDSSFDSLNQINPFEVLGIKPGCSKSELKDAYKSMLLVTHPDKHQGDVSMVMMVMDAYKAISKYHMTEIVENVSSEGSSAGKAELKYDPTNVTNNDDINIDGLNKELYDSLVKDGKMDLDKFNKLFIAIKPLPNNGYDDIIKKHKNKNFVNKSLVVSKLNPDSLLSSNFDVADFTHSETNNFGSQCTSNDRLNYSDYVEAFTDQSDLERQLNENYTERNMSVESVKRERNSVDYQQISVRDQAILDDLDFKKAQIESTRVVRLQKEDERTKNQYGFFGRLLKK